MTEESGVECDVQPPLGRAGVELSAAQRARCERNRLRARQLRDARLAPRPHA